VPVTVTSADEGGTERPGVVLFPEIFGINEFILDTAHALARLGYVVATPNCTTGATPRRCHTRGTEALRWR